jgi:hypothetical protein
MYLKAAFGETFDTGDEAAMQKAVAGFLASYRSRLSFARRAAGLIGPLGALPRRP